MPMLALLSIGAKAQQDAEPRADACFAKYLRQGSARRRAEAQAVGQ